ncbi:cupin domain-containing protein [Sorangium sp. So ce291]|uniref:cupin domain-containing protein n=1 Tax=Sorangium sp. So ce291 TaxID=3133294 RepID=UPI003F621F6B
MNTTTFHPKQHQVLETVAPGIQFSFLRRHGGGQGLTALVRMEKGAHARHHNHPGGEETYLVSGKLRIGERTLLPGDYLWTAPGESHEGYAEEESIFFVVLPGGLDLTDAR